MTSFAEANGFEANYFRPADDSDADRIDAITQAVNDGAITPAMAIAISFFIVHAPFCAWLIWRAGQPAAALLLLPRIIQVVRSLCNREVESCGLQKIYIFL